MKIDSLAGSKYTIYLMSIFIFFGFSSIATAACCDGISKLEWKNSAEILEYRSCGCADSCWVAELRSKKTRRLKADSGATVKKLIFQLTLAKLGGNRSASMKVIVLALKMMTNSKQSMKK